MNQRLIHDSAFAAAVVLLERFASFIPEQERRHAFDFAYTTAKGALEAYEIKMNRMQARLHPGTN